jgi:hypothetical protein
MEALLNAQRCRKVDPGLSISIQTDLPSHPGLSDAFDLVIPFISPEHSYRDKVSCLASLPYDETLFLDSDACLIQPAADLFELLQGCDLAAAHAPVRLPPGWCDPAVPLVFPELNTGVLLMRRSRVVENLMASWLILYDNLKHDYGQAWDQASFRSVLWSFLQHQHLTFLHLPPEANLRTTKPWFAGRGLRVQVVHGRFPSAEFDEFVEFLNADVDRFRTWEQWVGLHPKTSIRPRFDRTFE